MTIEYLQFCRLYSVEFAAGSDRSKSLQHTGRWQVFVQSKNALLKFSSTFIPFSSFGSAHAIDQLKNGDEAPLFAHLDSASSGQVLDQLNLIGK